MCLVLQRPGQRGGTYALRNVACRAVWHDSYRRVNKHTAAACISVLACLASLIFPPALSPASAMSGGEQNAVNEEVVDYSESLTEAEKAAAKALQKSCFAVVIDLNQETDPDLPLSLDEGSQPLSTPPPPKRLVRRMPVIPSLEEPKRSKIVSNPVAGSSAPASSPEKHAEPSDPKDSIYGSVPPKSPTEPPDAPQPPSDLFQTEPPPLLPDFPPYFLCETWGEPGSTC